MDKSLLCGIDGGGTRTTVVVCDQDGHIFTSFTAESINHYAVGAEKAKATYLAIREELLARAGQLPDALYIGCSALAGEASGSQARAITGGVFQPSRMAMHSDVYIALLGFTRGRNGAMLIAGTGAMACGIDPRGTYRTCGGWGPILGDQGSAYHLAIMGIQAALRAYDGVDEPTTLTESLRLFFQLKKMEDLVDVVYNPPLEKSKIAAFAVEVERAAMDGDAIAQRILNKEIECLGKLALTIAAKCETSALGFYGGMLMKSPVVGELLREWLRAHGIKARTPEFNPEIGALLGSFQLLDLPITDAILANLRNYSTTF
jgi:N-acetylglucosamine kinase-like BadF-type ATPase